MALPRLLDRERSLALTPDGRSYRAQLGGTPQRAVDEKAMNDRIDAKRETGVVGQERIGHPPGKPAAAACGVETQQMVAVAFRFGDPQLADRTAVRQRVLHQKPPALNSRINVILQCNIHP